MIENFSIAETNKFSNLINNYTEGLAMLAPFYAYEPSKRGIFEASEKRKLKTENRTILVEVLKKQHSFLEITAKQAHNLEILADENCFTITTGHQLCLLTGPLYVIYKIATVINAASQLNLEQKNFKYVPLFWLASEDHDFEEVNHINLNHKKYEWNKNAEKKPVGELNLDGLDDFWENIEAVLRNSIIVNKWKVFSQKAKTLSEFTRMIIQDLFGEEGVLILDPNNIRLKELFLPFAIQELKGQNFQEEVNIQSDKLEFLGYKTQVNARDTNLFYIKDGKRNRVVKNVAEFVIGNSNYSLDNLIQLFEDNPIGISPNVVLRPVYQEIILPNVAYIGGGAEIAYWMQLKSFFVANVIPFPVLLLRNSFLWLDEKPLNKIEKFGLGLIELFDSIGNLEKKLSYNEDEQQFFIQVNKKQNEIFSKIQEELTKIEPTLNGAVQAGLTKSNKLLMNLEKKLIKAKVRKNELQLKQLKEVFDYIYPSGILQERYDNVLKFLDQDYQFISRCIGLANPFEKQFIVSTI